MPDYAALREQHRTLMQELQQVRDEPDTGTCGGPYGQYAADLQSLTAEASGMPKRVFELSEQQNEGIRLIEEWFADPSRQEFHLGGYAGTGKTVTISELSKRLDKKGVQHEIASFTGKAVSVLKKKGLWQARTLHDLLYKYTYDSLRHKYIAQRRPSLFGCKLVIVDEASMVSTSLYEDLKWFGVKMLFVGDPAQLEPVGDNPNLVRNCDYTFTEIHRQAHKSPILRLAQAVRRREIETPHVCEYDRDNGKLVVIDQVDEIEDKYDVVICGKNATRHRVNALRRKQRGYPEGSTLEEGETVICLKNSKDWNVYNGMTFKVKRIRMLSLVSHQFATFECDLEDELGQVRQDVPITSQFFGKDYRREEEKNRNAIPFDYGYCLTAHKAQGSSWPSVLVIDEPIYGTDSARWRYTSITRAETSLTYLL